MEAVVLAGGLGTRLRSVVSDLPKCMANVAGNPFLYYILKYLSDNKISHVILSLGYKHEHIVDWVKKTEWPFKITFSIEDKPLGTGGAIKQALSHATEKQILVMNGDTFFNIRLEEFFSNHRVKNAQVSIALKPMRNFDRYGSVEVDADLKVLSFNEKRYFDSGQINGGVYLINLESGLFDSHNGRFSFESDILEAMVGKLDFYGFVNDGYFIDIGIPADYAKANMDFEKM